jgi:hypothetical protein
VAAGTAYLHQRGSGEERGHGVVLGVGELDAEDLVVRRDFAEPP